MHGNSVLTPELQEALCAEIAEGVPIKYAVKVVSIRESTFYNWMSKAKLEGADNDIYRSFVESIKRARGQFVSWHIKNLKRHSEDTWQSSAWLLERLDPAHFGRKETEQIAALQKLIQELKAKVDAMTRMDDEPHIVGGS